MKKSELIEALQEIPGDDNVYIYDWESDLLKRIEVAVKEYPHYIGNEIVEKDILHDDNVVLDIDYWADLVRHDLDFGSEFGSEYKCYNKYEYDLDGTIELRKESEHMYCRPVIFIGEYLEMSEIIRTKAIYNSEDAEYKEQLDKSTKTEYESEDVDESDDPEYIEYLRLKEKYDQR